MYAALLSETRETDKADEVLRKLQSLEPDDPEIAVPPRDELPRGPPPRRGRAGARGPQEVARRRRRRTAPRRARSTGSSRTSPTSRRTTPRATSLLDAAPEGRGRPQPAGVQPPRADRARPGGLGRPVCASRATRTGCPGRRRRTCARRTRSSSCAPRRPTTRPRARRSSRRSPPRTSRESSRPPTPGSASTSTGARPRPLARASSASPRIRSSCSGSPPRSSATRRSESPRRRSRSSSRSAPTTLPGMNYLGYMWADRGENLPRALELIRKAVDLEPVERGVPRFARLGVLPARQARQGRGEPHRRLGAEPGRRDRRGAPRRPLAEEGRPREGARELETRSHAQARARREVAASKRSSGRPTAPTRRSDRESPSAAGCRCGSAVGLFVFLEGGCGSGRPQGASSDAGARPAAEAPPSSPSKKSPLRPSPPTKLPASRPGIPPAASRRSSRRRSRRRSARSAAGISPSGGTGRAALSSGARRRRSRGREEGEFFE